MRAVKASVVPPVAAWAFSEIEHRQKVLLGGVPTSMPRLWVRVPFVLLKALCSSIGSPELSPVMDCTSR